MKCRTKADSLTTEQQAGQLFMIGVSTSGLDDKTRKAIESGSIGAVVLLGNSTEGASRISAITSELGEIQSSGMPLLIAVDQEGGHIQRLKGPGFSDIPNAVEQGALADGQLRSRAQTWGTELADAGIHYDLAPVADVVPKDKQDSNAPIGKRNRNFGNDATAVSRSVVEFTQGMQDARIATSLKHFPGLGEVTVNTDHGVAKDSDITADGESLEPFRKGIEAGADSVMISSAIFTRRGFSARRSSPTCCVAISASRGWPSATTWARRSPWGMSNPATGPSGSSQRVGICSSTPIHR